MQAQLGLRFSTASKRERRRPIFGQAQLALASGNRGLSAETQPSVTPQIETYKGIRLGRCPCSCLFHLVCHSQKEYATHPPLQEIKPLVSHQRYTRRAVILTLKSGSKKETPAMGKKLLLLACLASCACPVAAAQADAKNNTTDWNKYKPTSIVTPIFSEVVVRPYPDGFVEAYANTHGANYINEMVLKGETFNQWSQMITTTGKEGLSSDANLTPRLFLDRIAGGFKRMCPDTFSARGIGTATISGHDAFFAWASCGTLKSAESAHSESTLFIAIKGTQDYYTLQWAERGPASSQPILYDEAKWGERLKKLSSVKTYPRVPVEPTPNPGSSDQK
jgi:hypothetical protein